MILIEEAMVMWSEDWRGGAIERTSLDQVVGRNGWTE